MNSTDGKPNAIRLILPFPPSVNHYWIRQRRGFRISPEGMAYRAETIRRWPRAFPMFVGPVKVDIAYTQPDRRKRDLDNLVKCVLDSLTHAGAWKDDAQVHDLHVSWGHERHPCAVVEIESIA